MKKTVCPKCHHSFSTRGGNADRHITICNGSYQPYKKLDICPHCDTDLINKKASEKANHIRWCDKNPKSKDYRLAASNRIKDNRIGSVLSEETKEKIRQAHKDGKYSHIKHSEWWVGKNHSDNTKEKIRQKALLSPHRRLKRKMIEYKGIFLDSTWELELAKRLDSIGIKWIRPDPLIWIDDEGNSHHYFPDFYLPDYNLFLDPKNQQAVKVQKKKLDLLLLQHSNIKILTSLEECKTFSI